MYCTYVRRGGYPVCPLTHVHPGIYEVRQLEQVSNRKGKRERENTNVELLEPDDEKVNCLKRRRQRETLYPEDD